MMRNGVSRPLGRTGGISGAATTNPPAVIACSFSGIELISKG
jgi:hypothetical protein